MRESLLRFFFGADVFISYSREDGADYALALAGELTKRGVVCSFDQWGTPAGKRLPEELKRSLRRSTMLVIVGTAAAQQSDNVGEEIEIFRRTKRPVIPISFGSLVGATWHALIEGMAITNEDAEGHRPSERVVERIVNAEGFTRRNKRLRNVFWATVVGTLLVVTAGAVVVRQMQALVANARAQQTMAERQQRRALSERLANEAEKALDQSPQKSLAVATLAVKLYFDPHDPRVPAAERALRRALSVNGGRALAPGMSSAADPAISRDRHWLATAKDGDLLLWDLTRGVSDKPLHRFAKAGGERFTFSPDGQWLTSGSHLIRLPTKSRPASVYAPEGVDAVVFTPGGRWAIVMRETTLKLWDLHAPDPSAAVVTLGADFPAIAAALEQLPTDDPRHEQLKDRLLDAFAQRAAFSEDLRRVLLFAEKQKRDPIVFDLTARDPQKNGVVLRGCAPMSTGMFDSSPDGRWVAAVKYDGSEKNPSFRTCVWDLKTAGPDHPWLSYPGNDVLAFSGDGNWLAAGGDDAKIRLWDLRSPNPSRLFLQLGGYSGPISALRFISDGCWLAGSAIYADHRKENHAIQLWDLSQPGNGVALDDVLGDLRLLTFSPDNRWLVAAQHEDEVLRAPPLHVWRLPAAEHTLLRGHDGPVNGVSFTTDGKELITRGTDKHLRAWDLAEGRNWSTSPQLLRAGNGAVVASLVTPDNRWLVAANRYHGGNLWNLERQTATSFMGDVATAHLMRLSPDSRWFVRGEGGSIHTKDPDLHLYRLAAGAASHPIRLSLGSPIEAAEFTPDGRRLITACDRGVWSWELSQANGSASVTPMLLVRESGAVRSIAVAPDGRWLVVVRRNSAEALLRRLDAPAPTIPLRGHTSEVMAAAFSPDRRWLATAEERGIVRLWDLTALATPKVLVSGQHAKWVAFSPNSRWLIVTDGSDDFESPNYETFFSTVWDLSNPAEPKRAMVTRSFGKGLDNPLFSPDSRWLLTNCNEHCAAEDLGPSTITTQTLMLWDLNAPAARPKIFRVDGLQAAFSPNGRWLLVGATLWDLTAPDFTASAIELPLVSREKSWVIEAVAFTYDSRRAIVCTDDVLVYDLDTADLLRTAARAAVRNLTAAEFRELLPAERYRKAFVHLP